MKPLHPSIYTLVLIGALTGLILGAVGGYALGYEHGWERALKHDDNPSLSIQSFNDCVAAGNPVMESYPRQCRSQDGRHFVESISTPELTPPPTKPTTENGCIIGGCSSQLCVEAGATPIVSTCEYRAEYSCFQSARCERQTDGRCGWTETNELVNCLKNPPPLR